MVKKLTEEQKEVLKKMVDNECEVCHKQDEELEIHRINRGIAGGKYIPRNIMVVCKKCHDLLHYKEFN